MRDYDITEQAMMDSFLGGLTDKFVETNDNDYSEYIGRPVEFIEEVLGETLTEGQKELAESVEENDFTIAMSGNATGKSMLASRLAVYFFKVYTVACEVYLVATSKSQLERVLWKELTIITEKFPHLFEGCTVLTKKVERNPECTITAVVIPLTGTEATIEGKLSGSHVSGHEGEIVQIYILDEADSLPNADAVWRAIESCLSGPNAKSVALFNPRHGAGPLPEMVRNGVGNVVTLTEFDHPNVVQGTDEDGREVIAGAITRSKVIQRVHSWTRPLTKGENKDSTCFELPSYLCGLEGFKNRAGKPLPPLEEGWRKVTSPEFDYMVLARFPAKGHKQLISMDWINTARAKYDSYLAGNGGVFVKPEFVTGVAGLDVAGFGEDANVLLTRYGIFVSPLVSWGGLDPAETGARAVTEMQGMDVGSVYVDSTGLGMSTAPVMKREFNSPAVSVHFAEKAGKSCELGDFFNKKAELYFAVRDALRKGELALPPDENLIQELLAYSYDIDDKGKVRVTDKSTIKLLIKRSSDRSDALALSYYTDSAFDGMDLS